jgi:hypothetical protein
MPLAGFEPAIPATKRPQTYTLDRAATGIGFERIVTIIINSAILIEAEDAFCTYIAPA